MNMDIALLKLAEPVKLNEFVNVACLPSKDDKLEQGTMVTTAGWGHTKEGNDYHSVWLLVSYSQSRLGYEVQQAWQNDKYANTAPATGMIVFRKCQSARA